MTKVIDLTQAPPFQERKPIVFKLSVNNYHNKYIIQESLSVPPDWDFIELVLSSSRKQDYDIMFCYMEGKREDGVIILGNFNDGIVN